MKKIKVLLVDDEEKFAQMVKINLEMTGAYEVRTESLGSKGLEAAREFGPDVIFMDIMMRDIGGPMAVTQIRSDMKFKDTPIVYLSAAVPKQGAELGDDRIAGCPYISKPVQIGKLILAIRKYVP